MNPTRKGRWLVVAVAATLASVVPVAPGVTAPLPVERIATAPYNVAAPERGSGYLRGRPVTYDIVDGWAVVEGDIIIGRADVLGRAAPVEDAAGAPTKGFAIDNALRLWPKNGAVFEVPYAIEVDPSGTVPSTVAAFNAIFAGFMQWVPRAAQADYVAFSLNLAAGSPACSSALGRRGGRQVINGPAACSKGALLHEMGHAVGLYHEQSRPDRDQYLDYAAANVAKAFRSQYDPPATNRQIATAYDYGSLMHYGALSFSANGTPAMVTIPQGIEIGQRRGYSESDIDAVYRLYGAAPSAVTVTSAPPGMKVTVDEAVVTTPQAFNWALGTVHTIDVPQATQTLGTASYLFGRWNVDIAADGAAGRTVTVRPGRGGATNPAAAPDVTVYSANFVRLFVFSETPTGDTQAAAAATTLSVLPAPQSYAGLTGTFFRNEQLISLTASVKAGFEFGGWVTAGLTRTSADSSALPLGQSAVPLPALVTDTGAAAITASGFASSKPLLRVRGRSSDGTVDGFVVRIDGTTSVRTPFTSVFTVFASGTHAVEAVTPQTDAAAVTRYQFANWDGAAANPTTATVPTVAPTNEITANFTTQHLVTALPTGSCFGSVATAPAPADRYFNHGQSAALNAVPGAGFVFAGWSGDLLGMAAQQTVVVTNEVYATAQFNTVAIPLAITGMSRQYAVTGAAGFDLTLYGTGFTPSSRVGINGFFAAASRVTYVDANRMRVAVVAADFAAPGEILVQVINTAGANCQLGAAAALPVRAAGYTPPATVDVVEFYHAALDHYFITANTDEIAKLDDGTFKGWARTGNSFRVFAADSIALATDVAKTVCRFYGNPAAGLDSHFYSAVKQECDDVKRKFPDSWVFESADVFQAITPDHVTGSCPEGSAAVYRLFNNRTDVNHRYTSELAVRAQMIAKGYIPEGYGDIGVVLCTPT